VPGLVRVLVAAVLGLAGASGYVNPTPGKDVALQIAGMHRAEVQKDLVYAPGRGLDVYRPRGVRRPLPAVLFVHGSGGSKDAGVYVGWGQLAAASGLAGVIFDNNSVQTDIAAAIRYVRRHQRRLGIDGDRLCLASFSAGVLPSMLVALKESVGRLRCAAAFYGPLDAYYEQSSPLAHLKKTSQPVLVAKAGIDVAPINTSIDRFVAKARRVGARVELLVHGRGHGFDAHQTSPRSRAILRRTLAFLRRHLMP
jgi:dipeptidyl aminopeptidase/acylaminoacyl peptidase